MKLPRDLTGGELLELHFSKIHPLWMSCVPMIKETTVSPSK